MNSFQQNVIKHKIGLLNLAAELGNVSRACKVMGFVTLYFLRSPAHARWLLDFIAKLEVGKDMEQGLTD